MVTLTKKEQIAYNAGAKVQTAKGVVQKPTPSTGTQAPTTAATTQLPITTTAPTQPTTTTQPTASTTNVAPGSIAYDKLTPDQKRATDLGRALGWVPADKTATGGLLGGYLDSNPAAKAYYVKLMNEGATSIKPGSVPYDALNPEQKRATDIGRQMGLLSAQETATGGLLQQRIQASDANTQTRYKQFWDSGATGAQTSLPQYLQDQVQNPTLPKGTEFVPTLQQVQQNELLDSVNYTTGQQGNVQAQQVSPTGANVNAATATAPNQIQGTQATAGQTSAQDALAGVSTASGTYDATQITGQTPQAQAMQGTVSPLATVKGQLDALYSEFDNGATPAWAVGAIRKAEEAMAARGMGASSIGAAAIVTAVQESAINIAAKDASTYFQMDLTNLNNKQQTELTNVQLRQQSLLSDQAASNAAKQFNATSVSQIQQFQAQLIAQIQNQNADRMQAVSVFNASEQNKIATQNEANRLQTELFNTGQINEIAKINSQLQSQRELANAQLKASVEQFNANLNQQREQFNTNMRAQIDQSNVTWRRTINTQNTAAINAANQANVQNLFNLSQSAQNNLWQAWRDEAAWLFTAQEAQKDRDFQLLMAANGQQFYSDTATNAQSYQMWSNIAKTISTFFGSK